MPKICGRKATSLTSFLFLYTICLIAIVPRLAVAEKKNYYETKLLKRANDSPVAALLYSGKCRGF